MEIKKLGADVEEIMDAVLDELESFMAQEIINAIKEGKRYIGFVISDLDLGKVDLKKDGLYAKQKVVSYTSDEWSKLTPIDLNNEEVRILTNKSINQTRLVN